MTVWADYLRGAYACLEGLGVLINLPPPLKRRQETFFHATDFSM